jgi:hypothetical protein
MASGGTATDCDVRLINGAYTSAISDPATVPDEDVAYSSTSIVLSGSATAADEDINVELDTGGAYYSIVGSATDRILLALKFTAGAVGNSEIGVTLYIRDRAA